jgi:hypothetical protein
MNKLFPALRYLVKSLSMGIGIGFLVILSTVAVTDWVFHLTDRYNTAHYVVSLTVPFELTAGAFSLLIGLVLFIPNFRVMLANGISRKTFFLASLPAAGTAAAAFSIFNLAVVKVHGLFWPINSISDQIYPSAGLGFQLILQFALYFLLIMSGQIVTLAYYRSNVPGKWALSLTPLVLVLILQQDAVNFRGSINQAIWDYLRWSFFYSRASALLLVYAAILSGLVYLMVRRAPVKD